MIFLDTSALVNALSGDRAAAAALHDAFERGERVRLPALVLFEWLRGPRRAQELAAQDALFPASAAIAFGPAEAASAAMICKRIGETRGREFDIAIAACAVCHDATLWTFNLEDFSDIPGLRVTTPR